MKRCALLVLTLCSGCLWSRGNVDAWVATWTAAQQLVEERNLPPAPGLAGNTLRQFVHVSVGGRRIRLRLSNVFGDAPVALEDVSVARAHGPGQVDQPTARGVRFGGARAITIAAGQSVVSDPVELEMAALSDVAVTIRFGRVPVAHTGHPGSRTTSYVADSVATDHWYFLAGIDVVSDAAAVAVMGNSITDGRGSRTNGNNRWPDNLARRLQADERTRHVAVINAGIGGNRVLRDGLGPSALSRLERDVLSQPGIRWLVLFEGVNDLGTAAPADADRVASDLIAAFTQMAATARARGIRVYGATIMPFGASFYDAPEREAGRQRVNAWIRTGRVFDAVIDLDAAVRDASNPTRLRSDADTGDHLHPNEHGHELLAAAVDLSLFTR
jgi:lysophospholipase L1-like esterase